MLTAPPKKSAKYKKLEKLKTNLLLAMLVCLLKQVKK